MNWKLKIVSAVYLFLGFVLVSLGGVRSFTEGGAERTLGNIASYISQFFIGLDHALRAFYGTPSVEAIILVGVGAAAVGIGFGLWRERGWARGIALTVAIIGVPYNGLILLLAFLPEIGAPYVLFALAPLVFHVFTALVLLRRRRGV